MGENDESVDVDNLLEQAFQRVEDSDKNGKEGKSKHPMDDIIMNEAKKAGLGTPRSADQDDGVAEKRRSDNRRRHQSSSSSADADSDEDRSKSRRKKRSRSREKRSRSHDRKKRDSSRDRKKKKSRSPDDRRRSKKRSDSRERKHKSRSRSKDRSSRKRSSRDRDVSRERLPSRRRSRSRSPDRSRNVGRRDSPPSWRRSPPPRPQRLPGPERRDVMPFTARKSPPRGAKMDMTPEERDERTIFILQLSRNTRPRDLEEFFSSVGHVRDVRIITDSKTRRSKGIAYVEFWEREGVPLAMGLNGEKLVGCPLVIQMTCAERNRVANSTMGGAIGFGLSNSVGPLKICISNLHSHINDDMLSAIFEPFGKIEKCSIERDSTGSSKGIGFVTFRHTEEGKRAMEQLNGFELAGRNIRLTTIDDEPQQPQAQQQQLSLDAEDRMNLNSQGRQQLMQKLAHGTGMELPSHQIQAPPVHYQGKEETLVVAAAAAPAMTTEGIPAIATQCFMLSNMFDPASESEPGWELDVRDDVIEECQSCVHIYVDKASESGNVYVKCPTAAIAYKSVTALHGRWFAGKIITANYVPVNSYHDLFPEARLASVPLQTRQR